MGVGRNERYRDALAPGDLALIYLPAPEAEFIGRAELATAVHDWTPSEADANPGDSPSGVLLSHVEEWEPAVPMDTVVRRIDPTASNPLVQANATAGFRMGVVRITGAEYENVLALSRPRGRARSLVGGPRGLQPEDVVGGHRSREAGEIELSDGLGDDEALDRGVDPLADQDLPARRPRA